MTATTFPVGYHDLHPDLSMNFQMNRWFGGVGESDMVVFFGGFDSLEPHPCILN